MKPLKILILEDNPIVAEDIMSLIEELGYRPIGPAYNIQEAKEIAEEGRPELAVLDIHLGNDEENGIHFAEWLNAHLPVPIIFLTAFVDEHILNDAKNVYPSQYLIKPLNCQQLKVAIKIVENNYYYPDKSYANKVHLYKLNQSLSDPLSEREAEVLLMLLEGLGNQQIANGLCISQNTVKTHLKNIFFKIDVQSRTELISKIYYL